MGMIAIGLASAYGGAYSLSLGVAEIFVMKRRGRIAGGFKQNQSKKGN